VPAEGLYQNVGAGERPGSGLQRLAIIDGCHGRSSFEEQSCCPVEMSVGPGVEVRNG
jgi:hypothetical protein